MNEDKTLTSSEDVTNSASPRTNVKRFRRKIENVVQIYVMDHEVTMQNDEFNTLVLAAARHYDEELKYVQEVQESEDARRERALYIQRLERALDHFEIVS